MSEYFKAMLSVAIEFARSKGISDHEIRVMFCEVHDEFDMKKDIV